MAAPADAPPSSGDKKPQNPVPQVAPPTVDDHRDAKVEVVKESSPTSVFVNLEPIREEQVQNAVKFLSHPKVRGSPVMYRRSFLERKGLTKEEIDEAFRRVPDPTPTVTTTEPVVANQDGQINVQPQASSQVLQSNPAQHVSSISNIGTVSRFHWSHALFAVGFLAVSGAGTVVLFKNAIIPKLKLWIRKVVSEEEEVLQKKNNGKPSIVEEAAAAAKAAAAAAADVTRASQQMFTIKSEEKKFIEELISILNAQVNEMKSMGSTIQTLEERQSKRITAEQRDDQRVLGTSSRQPYANGKADFDSRSVRSLSPPVPLEPSVAPHPKSYMEIMGMMQRGERPPNFKEINDMPPNPNHPVSNPRLAPRPKPWEVPQAQVSSTNILKTQETSGTSNYEFPGNQSNADDAVPWWQRKYVRITEIEQNPRSPNMLGNEQPFQRSWVPPQPPPIVMPEAAAAIRLPKKPSYAMTDDQLLARSTDVTDKLQRITKISEPGGTVEANDETSAALLG